MNTLIFTAVNTYLTIQKSEESCEICPPEIHDILILLAAHLKRGQTRIVRKREAVSF
jgi:hypothetical protein